MIGPSSRPDADVDYTFAQIAVREALVDYGGNCGNMSSAVGPFAVEEGIVPAPPDGEAVVRIHNTNTSKVIAARFPVAGGALAPDGGLEIDGVKVELATTDVFETDSGVGGSRVTHTGGRAAYHAAEKLKEAIAQEAARLGTPGARVMRNRTTPPTTSAAIRTTRNPIRSPRTPPRGDTNAPTSAARPITSPIADASPGPGPVRPSTR